MNTKERIAKEALILFSENGYAATSVRDIAEAVGIKDSSLYNHYKSKREIFDYVIEFYSKAGEEKYFTFYKAGEIPAGTTELFRDPRVLTEIGKRIFISLTADEESCRLRKLLMTEMYRDENARRAYAKYLKEPLSWTVLLFSHLMDAGIFARADAEVLAYEFMAPIYTLQSECECGAASLDAALDLMKRHVEYFYERNMEGRI